jgi:XRE family transcriptional regulator, fatty acid utilization regulator
VTRHVAGARIRQLRRDRGLTQAALARVLGLSPSYVTQLERDQRPLTVPVLLKIGETFGVDPDFFSAEDGARLTAELRDALLDDAVDVQLSAAEIGELATSSPGVARALIGLRQRYRAAVELTASLAGDDAVAAAAPMPHEEVRDFFYARRNHVEELDAAAERLAEELDAGAGEMRAALARRLRDHHGVRSVLDGAGDREQRRLERNVGVLRVSSHLRPGQQAFQLATQLAFLEQDELLRSLVEEGALASDESRALARIGLASYFAGAVLMPYGQFRRAAEALRYDVELLGDRFGVGFESVCHRLSTLQRPRLRGVPFSFVRVDRAGNISKRQSATGFHFSRGGGTCPLWSVYDAFAAPGTIQTQIAEMPDGRHYFWIARTVTRRRRGFGTAPQTFAIGLGCELRHARRLVYSTGLDLDDLQAATPIGMGCKACERTECPQRAFPPIGRALDVDEDHRSFAPYAVERGS